MKIVAFRLTDGGRIYVNPQYITYFFRVTDDGENYTKLGMGEEEIDILEDSGEILEKLENL